MKLPDNIDVFFTISFKDTDGEERRHRFKFEANVLTNGTLNIVVDGVEGTPDEWREDIDNATYKALLVAYKPRGNLATLAMVLGGADAINAFLADTAARKKLFLELGLFDALKARILALITLAETFVVRQPKTKKIEKQAAPKKKAAAK